MKQRYFVMSRARPLQLCEKGVECHDFTAALLCVVAVVMKLSFQSPPSSKAVSLAVPQHRLRCVELSSAGVSCLALTRPHFLICRVAHTLPSVHSDIGISTTASPQPGGVPAERVNPSYQQCPFPIVPNTAE